MYCKLYITLLGDGGFCQREQQPNVVNNMLNKKTIEIK